MLLLRRFSSSSLGAFGSFAALASFAALSVAGCGAKVATVLESDDAAASPGPGPGTDAGPTGEPLDAGVDATGQTPVACATKGGVCLPIGSAAPPTYRQATATEASCTGTEVCWLPVGTSKPPVCQNDQACNADMTMSSFAGQCFGGICICKSGFIVQPDGRCGKTAPPECTTQSGKCTQQPATCPAGSLASDPATNMSCGDLIAAVCCFTENVCTGPSREVAGGGRIPIDMACCGTAGGASDRLCVNGWQTCPAGTTPVDKSVGGCL